MDSSTEGARRRLAPHLYIITDRHATAGRDLVAVVARALEALADPGLPEGLRVAVQLREKDLPTGQLLALARRLREVTTRAGTSLYINGRVDVALATQADGVHLGHGALGADDVRRIGPRLHRAISTHSADEVNRAREAGGHFVVFGPVYETPSKLGIMGAKGLHGLTGATGLALPVVALGGIDVSRVDDCFRSGACGVAVIRAVLAAADPKAATRKLLEAIVKPR